MWYWYMIVSKYYYSRDASSYDCVLYEDFTSLQQGIGIKIVSDL